jgi:hypothetical protein
VGSGGRSREPGLLPQTGAGAGAGASERSQRSAGPCTVEQMARDTVGLIDALYLGRTSRPDLHRRLIADGHLERDRRIDREAAKARVRSVLRQRSEHGEAGLSNAEIRKITRLNRYQVVRLMRELISEDSLIELTGKGRRAAYVHGNKLNAK